MLVKYIDHITVYVVLRKEQKKGEKYPKEIFLKVHLNFIILKKLALAIRVLLVLIMFCIIPNFLFSVCLNPFNAVTSSKRKLNRLHSLIKKKTKLQFMSLFLDWIFQK